MKKTSKNILGLILFIACFFVGQNVFASYDVYNFTYNTSDNAYNWYIDNATSTYFSYHANLGSYNTSPFINELNYNYFQSKNISEEWRSDYLITPSSNSFSFSFWTKSSRQHLVIKDVDFDSLDLFSNSYQISNSLYNCFEPRIIGSYDYAFFTLFNNSRNGGTGGNITTITSNGSSCLYSTDKWYFWTMVFDGNNIKFYIDGNLFREYSVSSSWDLTDHELEYWSKGYGGSLANLVAYDKALSEIEVGEIYNLDRYIGEEDLGVGGPVIDYDLTVSSPDNFSFQCFESSSVILNYDFCSSYGDIKQFKVALYDPNSNQSLFNNYYYSLLYDKEFFIGPQKCKGSVSVPIDSSFLSSCVPVSSDLFLKVLIDYYDDSPVGFSSYISDNFYYNYYLNSGDYFIRFNQAYYEFNNSYMFPDEVATSTILVSYDFCDSNNESVLESESFGLYFSGNLNGVATTSKLLAVYDISESGCSNNVYSVSFVSSYMDYIDGYIGLRVDGSDGVVYYNYANLLINNIPLNADYIVDSEEYSYLSNLIRFFSNYFDGLITPFKFVFPFNLFSDIPVYWSVAVPYDYSDGFLGVSFNENDNIYLDLPVGDIEVFGSEMMTREEKYSSFFADVRSFSRFLFVGVLFLIVYGLARRIYDALNEDNDNVNVKIKKK